MKPEWYEHSPNVLELAGFLVREEVLDDHEKINSYFRNPQLWSRDWNGYQIYKEACKQSGTEV